MRLHSHLSQLRDMLRGDEPVGRKLDFLIQEINRECNTIGSKCSDPDRYAGRGEHEGRGGEDPGAGAEHRVRERSMELVNIGFGNLIAAGRLIAVVSPDSAPIKRLIQETRDGGMLIDATYGRKTASVLIMDSDHVVLSALPAEKLAPRLGVRLEDLTEEEA